jgi:5'-nucleotidase
MSYNLSNKLVVAISSRALFDLEKENAIFEEEGLDAYYHYLLKNQHKTLHKGSAYRLIDNLLKINGYFDSQDKQVEVIILSKNNPAMSLRITNSIEHYGLAIERSGWTSGTNTAKYLKAFKVDLFLSASENDVKKALESRVAAAKILPSTNRARKSKGDQVRIAFDGDAVLFSKESEEIYQTKGLDAFIAHEKANRDNPLAQGPFAKLLMTISKIQAKFPHEDSPIRTSLVTARGVPTHERVIKTLDLWGVRVDEAFFLGGSEKYEILDAFGADIFFDDQDAHLKLSTSVVPSAKVY